MVERQVRSIGKIPKSVSSLSTEEEVLRDIKKQNFILIFHHYNNGSCGLCEINNSKSSEKMIWIFDKMTKSSPDTLGSILKKGKEKPVIKRSEAEGDYKKLFNTVPRDIDVLYESSQFQGNSGRIFFFTVTGSEQDRRNFLSVVSVNTEHFN